MNLAFVLYKYFPYGGLQRNFLRIALECQRRGHSIRVYAYSWQGDVPPGLDLRLLPKTGLTSQARNVRFSAAMKADLKLHPVDKVVGFNKMPGLDVYYAADGCYEERVSDLYRGILGWFYRQAGRYRHFSAYEKSVFGCAEKTLILMISNQQQRIFQRIYNTQSERLYMLPPGTARDRCAPENAAEIRDKFRNEFSIAEDELLLLMVGSGFKTKGVDRSLIALASLPQPLQDRTRLFILGQDNAHRFLQQSKRLGIAHRVTFFAGRKDVPIFLLAADVLLHPARHENAGMALLEALVAGLPVLCTPVCGNADYINQSGAGKVLDTIEFRQEDFNDQLRILLLDKDLRLTYAQKGLEFSTTTDLYSLPECASSKILE